MLIKPIATLSLITALVTLPVNWPFCSPGTHSAQHSSSHTGAADHHLDCPQGTALSSSCCVEQVTSTPAVQANLEVGKAVLGLSQTVTGITQVAKSELRLTASHAVPTDHSPPLTQLRI